MNLGDKYVTSNLTLSDLVNSYLNMIYYNINLLNLVSKKYKNHIRVLLNIFRRKYPVNATTRKGEKMVFDTFESFYNSLLGLDFDSENDVVYVENHSFHGGMNQGDNIAGIFKRKEYNFLDARGKTVIDVGAGIGDSAIYFVECGADKVISIEADKVSYGLAKRNIQANNAVDKVDLLWAEGVGEESNHLENIPQVSLKRIIESNSDKPLVLKIDCEGCEYEIIESLQGDELLKVKRIQIEYHYGYVNLKRKLESCGFKVSTSGPRYFSPRNLSRKSNSSQNVIRKNESMFLGWIYATNTLHEP